MIFKQLIVLMLLSVLVSCVTTEPTLASQQAVPKEKKLEIRLQTAKAYLQDGQYEAAMRHLKVAQEIENDSAELHEILALVLEKMGDEEKVEPEFKKALRIDSAYTRGRVNYGSYLMRQGRYQDAYKQFVIVSDDVYYQKRALGYEQLAICAEKLNKSDEAIKAYEKAVAIDPKSFNALFALTQNAYQKKNYPLAHQYLQAYREVAKPASAASLLLGIKIAREFRDAHEEASYAIALKNLYPRSQEYLDYLKLKGN